MSESRPRLLGVLIGDIEREASARVKYGLLFEALGRRFPLAGVHDATLRSLPRLVNAMQTFHPDLRRWKERFYKNVPAFRARSRYVAAHLAQMSGQCDIIFQVGVLFDAQWGAPMIPSVIYTDYTATLSARRPELGRSPFNPRQQQQWIALEGQAFRRAGHIFTRGQFVRESVIADYGIPPERVTAVGGGVNFAILPQAVPRQPDNVPTALFIGKDFYRKGADVLLKAFAQVHAETPNIRLSMMTAGPIPADLPLAGVEMILPTWDRNSIEELYLRADLFVLPSRLETWGDVLLEAMAFGLPCIGVHGEAMDEIIEDGRTGLNVPPDDETALGDALRRLLHDAPLRRKLGREARGRVEMYYTWNCVVDRMVPVIKRLIQKPLDLERRHV